jgi:hypothetical protein
MDKKTINTVAVVLGALGLLLILAGPAFHLIPSDIGIYAALASWVIGGLIKAFGERGKKEEKETKEEKKVEEEKEEEEE